MSAPRQPVPFRRQPAAPSHAEWLKAFWNRAYKENITGLSGMVAYNLMLAIFPFALLVLFIFGQIVDSPEIEESVIADIQRLFPNIEQEALENAIDRVRSSSTTIGVAAIVGGLWIGASFWGAMDTAFCRIYHVECRSWVEQKRFAFVMLAALTLLLAASVAVPAVESAALSSAEDLPLGLDELSAVRVAIVVIGGRPDLLRDVRKPRQSGHRRVPPRPQLGRPLRHQRRDDRLRAREHGCAGLDAGAVRRLRRVRVRPSRTTPRWCRPSSSETCPFAKPPSRESATSPDSPKSEVGLTTKPFYVKSDDPYKAGIPGANFTFTVSYGDPQPVAVIAKRSLGAVTAKWKVNGGPVQSAPTQEWTGERYTPAGVYYHQVRGVVTGTKPGDKVEVWFEGGGQRSESFTYSMALDTGRKVLVVAAEDYTGPHRSSKPMPQVRRHYLDALTANGIDADVYDVDARAGCSRTRWGCSATTGR